MASGAFAFHCDTYLAGTPAQCDQFDPADGYDSVSSAQAVRLETGLLVSLTAGRDQPREPATHAAAEAQLATLRHAVDQAPMSIAIFEGPAYYISFANAEVGLIWGRPLDQVMGRPHFEALPEVAGQGFEAIFADMYHTGLGWSDKSGQNRVLTFECHERQSPARQTSAL
ncbi:PAS domain-containing protein [Hymenobacter sp. UYAg731]